jgi:hypothetical protein
MSQVALQEHRLAIMTNWALWAGFGMCFVLSGFSRADPVTGLIGFAFVVAGFISHVIINRIFSTGFTTPQVSLALVAFVIAVLSFIASSVFDPSFGETDVLVGLIGFSAIMACFVVYIMINYGIRGSYAMIDRLNARGRG